MTTNTPAGWYPNPENANELRYWDGATWTEHTHPADAAADATAETAAMPVASGPAAPTEQFQVQPSDRGVAPDYTAVAPAAAYGAYGAGTGAPNDGDKKGLSRGAIIGIVVAAVVVILAIAGILFAVLNSGSDDEVEANPTPSVSNDGMAATDDATPGDTESAVPAEESATASGDAIIPDGWEVVESPSGLITYAHDPGLDDAGAFIDLETLSDQMDGIFPGATAEVSGMWIDTSATDSVGSTVMLLTTTGAVDAGNVDAELQAFVESASAGTEDLQTGDTETFVTAVGYDAARLAYSSSSFDEASYANITIVMSGDTAVFVFASSTTDAAASAQQGQQFADSLTINN